jgi:hypothetical protein
MSFEKVVAESIVGVEISYGLDLDDMSNTEVCEIVNDKTKGFISGFSKKLSDDGITIYDVYFVNCDKVTKVTGKNEFIQEDDVNDELCWEELGFIFIFGASTHNTDAIFMETSSVFDGDYYGYFYDIDDSWKMAQYEEGEDASGISESNDNSPTMKAINKFL